MVLPSLGSAVVLGAVEAPGSGLAADTTATRPPTSRSPASAPVRTVRRKPGPPEVGAAASGAVGASGVGGGVDGGGASRLPGGVGHQHHVSCHQADLEDGQEQQEDEGQQEGQLDAGLSGLDAGGGARGHVS